MAVQVVNSAQAVQDAYVAVLTAELDVVAAARMIHFSDVVGRARIQAEGKLQNARARFRLALQAPA